MIADTGPEDMDDYTPIPQPEDAFDQLIRVIARVSTDVWCEIRLSNAIWDAIGSPTACQNFTAWLADRWGRWEQGWHEAEAKDYLDHLAKGREYGEWLLPELRDLARDIDPAGATNQHRRSRYRSAYERT